MVPSQSFESLQQSTCFCILSGVRFLRYYYYYFAWFPFRILSCNLLGEAVVCSLWTPAQFYKNGPWADNIALLRDKEPSQPRLGSSPCEGTPSRFRLYVCSSGLLKCMCQRPSGTPCISVFQNPQRRGCILSLQHKVGFRKSHCPQQLWNGSTGHGGPMHYKGLDLVHSLSSWCKVTLHH